MNQPIYIKYQPDQDPVKVLEAAMRKHGERVAFVVIPEILFKRWKIGGHKWNVNTAGRPSK